MPRLAGILLGLSLVWPVAALAGDEASTVVLLSFDGTRPDQIRRPGLPTFARLLREGASAERLQPVFPSNTFPNHVSLVTGVAPERHGIVNNVFHDPQRGRYSYDADPTWIEVPPLWSVVAAHGVISASFHWVGSEGAWRDGRGPRYWKPFDTRTKPRTKVEQILAWLDLPRDQRPRLVTAWFHGADHAGHRHGPDAKEVDRALAVQDASLARLVAGLESRGLLRTTTLLLVSDHGMAAVRRRVNLQSALDDARVPARVQGGGGFSTVRLSKGARAEQVIGVAKSLGLEAWRPAAAPPELRLRNDRFGDVAVLAPLGTAITRLAGLKSLAAKLGLGRATMQGAHGYRASEPKMGGMLVAFGRGAPARQNLGRIRNLDVMPTVLALLGVPIPDELEGMPIQGLMPGAAPSPAGPLNR